MNSVRFFDVEGAVFFEKCLHEREKWEDVPHSKFKGNCGTLSCMTLSSDCTFGYQKLRF